jgi:hypothetical protein
MKKSSRVSHVFVLPASASARYCSGGFACCRCSTERSFSMRWTGERSPVPPFVLRGQELPRALCLKLSPHQIDLRGAGSRVVPRLDERARGGGRAAGGRPDETWERSARATGRGCRGTCGSDTRGLGPRRAPSLSERLSSGHPAPAGCCRERGCRRSRARGPGAARRRSEPHHRHADESGEQQPPGAVPRAIAPTRPRC